MQVSQSRDSIHVFLSNISTLSWHVSNLQGVGDASWYCFVLLLETIRTSAMRVIHITVKTEVTQKLRIMFVLCCST